MKRHMKKSIFYFLFCLLAVVSCKKSSKKLKIPSKPNIIFIYMDDLGYGDVSVNGAKGVKTPNIDKLAQSGLNFTDAHSSSATCTPSRYSLLTGRYAFRNNAHILPGTAPLIINPKRGTIASMLQDAGYKTAVIGKWHLGLGRGHKDWNKKIAPGPLEVGFDYSFIIPATLDRVPTVFIKNHKVANLKPGDTLKISYQHQLKDGFPTGLNHPNMVHMMADSQHSGAIINGISRIGYMKGGKSALWTDTSFATVLTRQAKNFIKKNKEHPFFLYFSSQDIHVPRMPSPKFRGKSRLGRRGDDIAEADWEVGQIVSFIKKLGLAKNTLVIFTSDNGPILNDGYADQAIYLANAVGDDPDGPYKGGKYSIYEAGTRMPTIVRWPGVVKPGVSHALVNQVDLYASLAHLTGQTLKSGNAPDSFNQLDAWLGKKQKGRQYMLEQAFTLGLRYGKWKYIAPQQKPTPEWLKNKKIPTGLGDSVQLYNLKKDPQETHNVADQHPDLVKKLQQRLKEIKSGPTRTMESQEKSDR
jgi:arylsulfatase A-like enzyme